MNERKVYYAVCQICGASYKYITDDPKKMFKHMERKDRCSIGLHPFPVSFRESSVIGYSREALGSDIDSNGTIL
jgi:hypothetical protein